MRESDSIHRRRRLEVICAATVTVALVLVAGVPSTAVVAQAARPDTAEPVSLVGRWTGRIFLRAGENVRVPDRLTLDIAACGGNLCGRIVGDDGACATTILVLGPQSGPDPERRSETSYRGRLSLSGIPPIATAAYLTKGGAGNEMRLELREADYPLYSRRLPPTFSASLTRTGPSTCAPQHTS